MAAEGRFFCWEKFKHIKNIKKREERKNNMQKVLTTEMVNPVKKLIPNHTYQFKKPFDAYFCMDGRVQIMNGAICKCQIVDSVSATLYFYGSDKNLPFEAACYINKIHKKYL